MERSSPVNQVRVIQMDQIRRHVDKASSHIDEKAEDIFRNYLKISKANLNGEKINNFLTTVVKETLVKELTDIIEIEEETDIDINCHKYNARESFLEELKEIYEKFSTITPAFKVEVRYSVDKTGCLKQWRIATDTKIEQIRADLFVETGIHPNHQCLEVSKTVVSSFGKPYDPPYDEVLQDNGSLPDKFVKCLRSGNELSIHMKIKESRLDKTTEWVPKTMPTWKYKQILVKA
jgi:hypothetical protein